MAIHPHLLVTGGLQPDGMLVGVPFRDVATLTEAFHQAALEPIPGGARLHAVARDHLRRVPDPGPAFTPGDAWPGSARLPEIVSITLTHGAVL